MGLVTHNIKKLRISQVLAILTILFSFLAILGWVYDIAFLLNIIPGTPTMKFNTALSFLFTGLSLLLFNSRSIHLKSLLYLTSSIIILSGFLTVFQYVFNVDLAIDNLFIEDNYTENHPGRMSIATAICFILLGFSFLKLKVRDKWANLFLKNIILIVTIVSFVSIIAFILQIPNDHKFKFLESMSIPTSTFFFLISLCVSVRNSSGGLKDLISSQKTGSRLVLMILPLVILIPVILSLILLFLSRNKIIESDFGIVLYTIVFILISVFYISIVSTRLNRTDEKRKELELSLKASNLELSYFKEALDASAIVAVTNSKGFIESVNNKFCEISKYKRSELIGQTHSLVNSENHPTGFFKNVWDTIKKGEIWSGEIKNKTKDGNYYWVYTTIVPFKNMQGEIQKYMAIRFDITEQKELEEQLILSLEKEQELGRLKSSFVSSASHEFRTPMAIIQSNAELLSLLAKNSDDQLQGKFEKIMQRIKSQVKHLTHLMDELLALGEINSGKNEVHAQSTDICKMCEELIEKCNFEQQDGRHIEFSVKGQQKSIEVDPSHIRQAVSNILSNALNYSLEGNPKLDLVYTDQGITINVSDKGLGISTTDLENIFQPFYRSINIREIPGTGLGLTIAKEYIELNGGLIKVKSQINKGSTFTIHLPYKTHYEKI